MKTLISPAASGLALALMAADTGGGSGAVDPIKKADPTPQPLGADQVKPEEPSPDPKPNAEGNAPKSDPNPPSAAKDAEKSAGGKGSYMVWCQPGHESLGIGQMILVSKAEAETLRGAGRARYASEAEVKAGKEHALKLEGI